MCRSIKTLRSGEAPAAYEEMQAAALQYVRKISGYRTPSRSNEAAFNAAVEDIAVATRALLSSLHSRSAQPRSG